MGKEVFYTTKDILGRVKISRNTLFLWLKKGKISEVARNRNGHRLFTKKDLGSILRYKNKKSYPSNK